MNKDEREMLELAAKAAGVPAYWSVDGTLQNRPMFVVQAGGGMGTMPYEAAWNPLTNDADALQLAVRLRLWVGQHHDGVTVSDLYARFTGPLEEDYGDSGDDCAKTRRAIVRAAAEIGRSME